MLILAHKTNTTAALRRALAGGFGAELDVRDAGGELVAAHDMPRGGEPRLADLLALYARLGAPGPLALNIKACGLQRKLAALLRRYKVREYFVFDMAVPDGLDYARRGLRLFTRHSEHEPAPAYYREAAGVWYDEFAAGRLGFAAIGRHLRAGKAVCVVSPELHKRPYARAWRELRALEGKAGCGLLLCTDHPRKAAQYFNGHH